MERLRAVGAGTTPFHVLITGFTALLARYTGCDDVTVGVVVAGRADRPVPARLTRVVPIGDELDQVILGRGRDETGAGPALPGEILFDDPLVSGRHARNCDSSKDG